MQTWQDKNPSCVYMLWTEENLKDFPFRNQKQIDDMSELNGKCDIMRYELLSKYGGIFLDADMECVNTLDDFFFENTRFTGYENEQNGFDLDTGTMLLLSSASMGFEPNDPLCNLCILELGKIDMVGKHGWQVCGNEFLATVAEKWKNQFPMKIYPSWYFLPKHGTGLEYRGTDKIYAKHYWGSTFGIYGTI
jgi:mannosyltransferase OCH1-like enzyme